MALPALVVAGAAKLIASQAVQAAAADAAQKLARNVYGRIMGERPVTDAEAAGEPDPLSTMVADLPTREEIVAAFALLQAELDQRHKRTNVMLIGVLLLQAATIGWLLLQS
jgi:hypothetical protein